jgi:hypothetical protein
MEPTAATTSRRSGVTSPGGELVIQNGKQNGMRRPLAMPSTLIGQAPSCDIRLKAEGIEPFHCLLVHGPGGLQLRDLDSKGSTRVNGKRVGNLYLRDGDVVALGELQLQVRLPPSEPGGAVATDRDTLRIQAAAVAAQQAALGDQEARLQQRQSALEQQQEQLSAHLEEKRQRLAQRQDQAQAERKALQAERDSYTRFLDRVRGDLTQAQMELVDGQQKVQAERRRLMDLHRRLKQRWHRHWVAEKKTLDARKEEVANEECNLAQLRDQLQKQEATLTRERLRFNGDYEIGRRHLHNAWAKVRQAQQKWRQRRHQESTALRLRARELAEAELALADSQRRLETEQADRNTQRLLLERELDGLNQRIRNYREKVFEQRQEISRLDVQLQERRSALTSFSASPVNPEAPDSASDKANLVLDKASAAQAAARQAGSSAPISDAPDGSLERRLADLDRLAGELADQRSHLAEQWQRLVATQDRWHKDRASAAAEMEAAAQQLQEQEQALEVRQKALQEADDALRERHRSLVHLRQHMVGWRARLKAREASWEGERLHLLTEMRHREALAKHHLHTLTQIRRRWAKQRSLELEKLRAEQAACEKLRTECAGLRQQWQQRFTELDGEKRLLVEKQLALAQHRQETQGADSVTDRHRLERLRRHWLTLNAATVRATAHERDELKNELDELESRHAEIQKQSASVAALEAKLAEKQTELEHKQTLLVSLHERMKNQLQTAQAQRACAEKQLARLREEVERIASSLIEEPEPPARSLDQAA